jgi:phage gp37-like protein
MLAVQTTQSGRYEFARIPPGDYLIAVADSAPGEWAGSTMKEHITNAPAPAHLQTGEKRTLDLALLP